MWGGACAKAERGREEEDRKKGARFDLSRGTEAEFGKTSRSHVMVGMVGSAEELALYFKCKLHGHVNNSQGSCSRTTCTTRLMSNFPNITD